MARQEQGETWLGLEGNGWTNLLFVATGMLLLGAPVHWGAKSPSPIVGLVLGACALLAVVHGDDVLGLVAANGRTKLVWGAAATVLIVVALLPRVGAKRADDDRDVRRRERAIDRERRSHGRVRVRADSRRA